MRALLSRSLAALVVASLATLMFASAVSAHIEAKSILVETESGVGECLESEITDTNEACGAAVYGPDGFSGTLFFAADEIGTTVTIVDYICVHTPSTGPFVAYSMGETFTLKLSEGGTLLDTATYSVTGGVECAGDNNAVVGGFTNGATITVPADGTVDYSLLISGVDPGAEVQALFSGFNSIRNRALDSDGGHADSASVKPPTDFIIPEAALAVLLVLTGGVTTAWFVSRRLRPRMLAA